LTSKIHHLVDGIGRPLVVLVSAGHAPLFEHLLAHLKVTRGSAGAPRTLRDRVRADKAYSSRAIRAELRRRGITAVIPEPSDQIAHRKRRGSRWPATSFRRRRLQGPQRHRTRIQHHQTMARPSHPRYDKLASYRGEAILRAITLWLPYLSDTP